MSFDIQWERTRTPEFKQYLKALLETELENTQLPAFLGKPTVLAVDLGPTPPSVSIRNIGDLSPELIQYLSKLLAASPDKSTPEDADLQIDVDVEFDSEVCLAFSCELKVNYPTVDFLSLPISLSASHIRFRACVSICQAKVGTLLTIFENSGLPLEFEVSMVSNVGDPARNILKNVGKIERFGAEVVRRLLWRELVFPAQRLLVSIHVSHISLLQQLVMRLFTHNFLQCHVRGCTQDNFPLPIEDAEVEKKEMEFSAEFLENYMSKVDWPALISTVNSLHIEIELPATAPEAPYEEPFLRSLHTVLLEYYVKNGKMTCRNCKHVYPIKDGIPNMLLNEEEV